MSPAEKKWCIQTIRSLKKHKRAIAFLDPVDPIYFNIPDYFDIVKHPMDLGTVERKLLADKYLNVDAFKSDVQLIFDNCYLYNNPGDPVCLDAKKLEEHYQKLCKKEPTMDNVNTASPTTMPEDQFKRCEALVRELKKPKYKGYAWPFENPVDAAAWGATDYYEIIKQPMDMSTYEKKLYNHQYSHEEQLAEDIRLMFRNCYTYNPPDHLVTNLGKEFEAVFERQWAKLHQQNPIKKKKSVNKKQHDDYVQDEPSLPPTLPQPTAESNHEVPTPTETKSNNGPTILRLKIKVSQPKEEPTISTPSSPPKPKIPGLALSKEPPTPTTNTPISNGPKLAIGTKPPSPVKEKKVDKPMLANHDKWLALAKKTSPPPSSQPPSQLPSQLPSTLPKLPATPTNQFKPKKEPTPSKPKEADIKPFDIADIYSQIHNEKRLKEQQARKEQDKRMRLEALNAVSIDISQQKMRFNEYEKEHMSRDQDWHDVYVWQRDTNDYRHMPAPGFVKRAQIKLPELRKRLLSKCVRLENSKNYQPVDMVDDGGSDMDVE
ncbi:Bromodomain-containing protein [Choanephora cucurbitarum]|nr:Bromodomain-containing protein [Choanephora cucurbitarum]